MTTVTALAVAERQEQIRENTITRLEAELARIDAQRQKAATGSAAQEAKHAAAHAKTGRALGDLKASSSCALCFTAQSTASTHTP